MSVLKNLWFPARDDLRERYPCTIVRIVKVKNDPARRIGVWIHVRFPDGNYHVSANAPDFDDALEMGLEKAEKRYQVYEAYIAPKLPF